MIHFRVAVGSFVLLEIHGFYREQVDAVEDGRPRFRLGFAAPEEVADGGLEDELSHVGSRRGELLS